MKIEALVALQATQKNEFERQLLKEKAELTTQLESKGKLDAATIALVNEEANRKLESEKNNKISKIAFVIKTEFNTSKHELTTAMQYP